MLNIKKVIKWRWYYDEIWIWNDGLGMGLGHDDRCSGINGIRNCSSD